MPKVKLPEVSLFLPDPTSCYDIATRKTYTFKDSMHRHLHFIALSAAGAREKNYFSVEIISSKTCHRHRL